MVRRVPKVQPYHSALEKIPWSKNHPRGQYAGLLGGGFCDFCHMPEIASAGVRSSPRFSVISSKVDPSSTATALISLKHASRFGKTLTSQPACGVLSPVV